MKRNAMNEPVTHEPIRHTTRPLFGSGKAVGLAAIVLLVGVAIGVALSPSLRRAPATTVAAPAAASLDATGKLPAGIVEISSDAQRNAGVRVLPVAAATVPATVDATGIVSPEESRVAHIRPLARGVVEKVSVSLGSRVERGQPLITLDNIALGELIGEYLAEKAAVQQAQTDLEVRRQMLTRGEALIKLEAIAQQELDVRRAEFQNAQAAVTSQRAKMAKVEEQIHRFGLTDGELATLTPEEGRSGHRVASHNVLRAPFTGIITKYDVAAGETVEPERELFTLSNLSTVWVLADVYEKDIGQIQKDSDVTIHVDTFPDRTFTGRLTYVSDVIDPKTRTAKVRCVVPNPDGALKLDMFAKVSIPSRERRKGIVIPQAAVQQIENQPVVFVRQSDTRFERRNVQLGTTGGGSVEVVSGLKPGERIVGDGSFYFKTALLRERIGES